MKSPTSTRVAAAAALAIAALVPGAVHAGHTDEQGVFDRQIHLAARVLADPGVDGEFAEELRAAEKPVHAIVQLHSLPRAGGQDLATLEALGIRPLAYLNGIEGIGTAYLASVSPGLVVDDPTFGELVRGLQPLLPLDRVDPALAAAQGELFDVLIRVFDDVSEAEAQAVFAAHGLKLVDDGTGRLWRATLTPDAIDALAAEDAVQWIQPAPVPEAAVDEARGLSNVDALQLFRATSDSFDGLTGRGVQVGIMDTGVDTSHRDFSGRFVRSLDDGDEHGSHVAGIAVGDGLMSDKNDDAGNANGGTIRQWRGMAPEAQIAAYPMIANDAGSFREAINTFGVDVSNHSYGWGWQGLYGAAVAAVDQIVRGDAGGIPARPAVWAAMNNASVGPRDCDGDGVNDGSFPQYPFPTVPPGGPCPTAFQAGYFSVLAPMKNPTTVGNVTDGGVHAASSSIGPTMDGRVKPDVVASGTSVFSVGADTDRNGNAVTGNGYRTKGGTSMAAPVVTGIAALLLERYAELRGVDLDEAPPLPSTLKAILVQTAVDLAGSDTTANFDTGAVTSYGQGPDWATGFGLVDARGAKALLDDGTFREGTVSPTAPTDTLTIPVEAGQDEVRVTLAWDDIAGTPNANAAAASLVNDLDLTVVEPDGTVHRPLVLPIPRPNDCDGNLANGIQVGTCIGLDSATQNYFGPAAEGVDRRNNVEQVVVRSDRGFEPGTWTVRVSADGGSFVRLPLGGEQRYSLAWSRPVRVPRAPDRFEPNDESRTLLGFGTHRHFRAGILDHYSGVTDAVERWSQSELDLNLHAVGDRDLFRIPLPDPAVEHPDVHPDPSVTEGLPECGTLTRLASGLPGSEPATDTIFISGAARVRVLTSAAGTELADRITLLRENPSVIACPRTRGIDELAFTVFTRLTELTEFHNYDLHVVYEILLHRVPNHADWLVELRERDAASDTLSVFPLLCPGGAFPDCGLDPFQRFEAAHPVSPRPGCEADGPGCPMYHPFWWPGTAALDLRISAPAGFAYTLLSSSGEALAEALPFSEQVALRTLASTAEAEERRLHVADLPAGFYVLRVDGPAATYELGFDPPPPPPDTDGDELADPFDACPEEAEDVDGFRDFDGCPDALLTVAIDVLPGSPVNPIDTGRPGVVPVAILSGTGFDATGVDPRTVCFGDADEPAERSCTPKANSPKREDVDRDGDVDLLFDFEVAETGVDPGDMRACLGGGTVHWEEIAGCDAVRAR